MFVKSEIQRDTSDDRYKVFKTSQNKNNYMSTKMLTINTI